MRALLVVLAQVAGLLAVTAGSARAASSLTLASSSDVAGQGGVTWTLTYTGWAGGDSYSTSTDVDLITDSLGVTWPTSPSDVSVSFSGPCSVSLAGVGPGPLSNSLRIPLSVSCPGQLNAGTLTIRISGITNPATTGTDTISYEDSFLDSTSTAGTLTLVSPSQPTYITLTPDPATGGAGSATWSIAFGTATEQATWSGTPTMTVTDADALAFPTSAASYTLTVGGVAYTATQATATYGGATLQFPAGVLPVPTGTGAVLRMSALTNPPAGDSDSVTLSMSGYAEMTSPAVSFPAASESGLNVALSDARAGATSTWTLTGVPGWPNDGEYAGWDQVSFQVADPMAFPSDPADYTFTYNGSQVLAATATASGGTGLMTVTTQCVGNWCYPASSANAPPTIDIRIRGVLNPPSGGTVTVGVTTNAVGFDPNNRTSASTTSSPFTLTPGSAICCVTVRPSSYVMGTRATWNLAFTTGFQATAGGSGISIVDADGALFSPNASDYSLTVAGATYAAQGVTTSAGQASLTFAPGVLPLPVNTAATISAGVTNPIRNGDSNAASDTVTVTPAGYGAGTAAFGLMPYTPLTNVAESMASAVAGAGTSWTTSFTMGNGGPLVGGDTITVEEVGLDPTFSSNPADYTVTPAAGATITAAAVAASAAQGPGSHARFVLTLPTGARVPVGTQVTVTANHVTNPATIAPGATNAVYVETSAAPSLQEAFFGPLSLSGVTASPSSTVAGVTGATWTVGFTNSAVVLGGGDTLTLADALGAVFPATRGDWSVTVNGGTPLVPAAVTASPGQAAITLPAGATVPGGAAVAIQVLDVANPATSSTTDTLTVATNRDPGVASNDLVFGARGGVYQLTPVFTANPMAAEAQATWTVAFTSTAALAAGTGTITVQIPGNAPGTPSLPAAASDYTLADTTAGGAATAVAGTPVVDNGFQATVVNPAEQTWAASAQVTLPFNVAVGDDLVLTIDGVTNPESLTNDATYPAALFTVATSAVPAPVAAAQGLAFTTAATANTGLPALASLPLVSNADGQAVTLTADGIGPCSSIGSTIPSTADTGTDQVGQGQTEDVAKCDLTTPGFVGTGGAAEPAQSTYTAPSPNVQLPLSCDFTYAPTAYATHLNSMWLFDDWLGTPVYTYTPAYWTPGQVQTGNYIYNGWEGGGFLDSNGNRIPDPTDATGSQAQNYYDGNFLHCAFQLFDPTGQTALSPLVVLNTDPSQNTSAATACPQGTPASVQTCYAVDARATLDATLPTVTGNYQLKYDVWTGWNNGGTILDGPQGCAWKQVSQEANYQLAASTASGNGYSDDWNVDGWTSQSSSGLGAIQCGLNPGFQQAGTTAPPPINYNQFWNGGTTGYNVGNGLSDRILGGSVSSPERQSGAETLAITVAPTAMLQLNVMPYKIIYQPPGDQSQAQFSVAQSAQTSTQISFGNSSSTATAVSAKVGTQSTSTQNNAGMLSLLGVVNQTQTTTDSSWDHSTTQTSATASTSASSLSWTDTYAQSWATAPDPTQLANPDVPPWYFDEFALSVHPQLALWDMGATSGVPHYALLNTDSTEVDVTAQELLTCSQGNPLPLPGSFSPPVTLQPSDCAGLLALDPFAAGGSQSTDPAQWIGTQATEFGSLSNTTRNSKTYTVTSQDAWSQSTTATSSFGSTVTDIESNSTAITNTTGFNFSTLAGLIPTGLGGTTAKAAEFAVKVGVGALGGLTGIGVSSGPTNTTSSSNSLSVQVNYQVSQASATTVHSENAASATLADNTNPIESNIWFDARWDTLMFQVPAPTVAAVSPSRATTAGGTSVTINGTGFWSGPVQVEFCSLGSDSCTPASSFDAVSDTEITATTPPLGASSVDVRVQGVGGLSAPVPADQITFVGATQTGAPASVAGVSPGSGPVGGGTTVTLTGSGFGQATQVWFGGVNPAEDPSVYASHQQSATPSPDAPAPTFRIVSDGQILACAPAVSGPETVYVSVYGPNGWSSADAPSQFAYTAGASGGPCAADTQPTSSGPPVVTSVSPAIGPAGGGTVVTINATGLQQGQLVVACDGQVCPLGQTPTLFTPPPVKFCPTGGGCSSATDVRLVDGAAAISAVAPPGSGTVDVEVGGPNGYSVAEAADKFSYLPPTPAAPGTQTLGPASIAVGADPNVTAAGLGSATIIATVLDTEDAPVSGAYVQFTTGAGQASVSQAVYSNALGVATATLTRSAPGPATVYTMVYGNPTLMSDPVTVSFEPVPVVSTLSAATGAAGDTLTVTGKGFTGATAVYFGSVAASSFTVSGDGTLTAVVPAGSGQVDVRVANVAVESGATPADSFTYSGGGATASGPSLSALTPDIGGVGGGTTVTLTGSGLTGVTAVAFGTAPAAFVVDSDSRITATAPPGATGPVEVTVTGPNGTSAGTPFTYLPLPAVTGVTPATGPAAGGTSVAIGGSGFAAGSTVKFGGTAATGVSLVSPGELIAVAPAGAGTVDVTVTTPCAAGETACGTSAPGLADRYTYGAASAVTAITPASGPSAGGTAVTITGSGFTGATAVSFGTQPASYTVESDGTIVATSPASAQGTVDVRVTGPDGTSRLTPADRFTYSGVVVTAVNPVNGPVAGGTPVTISGSGFTAATAVRFGTLAASYTVESDGTIVATSPAGFAGTVNISVSGPNGTSAATPADRFTFGTPPTVTAVGPARGPAAGGTQVTITGTGFTTATAVDFGTTPATIALVSDTQITVTAPRGAGTVDVTVTTSCGTPGTAAATSCGTSPVSTADQYTFLQPPSVSALSPSSGPTAGGTAVTITGTGFTTAAAVDFGTATATTFQVVSDTQITATAPAGGGTVDVTVTTSCASATATSCGTSATGAGGQYTYVSPAQTVVRTLAPGWNTLSIPFALAQDTVGATFSDGGASILAAYSYAGGRWQPVLTRPFFHQSERNATLPSPMAGLFIYIGGTADVTVTLTPATATGGSQQPASPPGTYALTQGWNLVGPSSGNLSEPVSVFLKGANVPEFDDPNAASLPVADPGSDTHDRVEDGYAYWVYAGDNNQVLASQIVPAP